MQPTLEKPTEQQTTSPINELPPSMANLEESFAAGPPPPQNPLAELPIQPPKKSKKKWIILVVLLLLIAGATVPIMMLTKKVKEKPPQNSSPVATTTSPLTKAHLIFTNSSTKNITVADSNAKKVYSLTYSTHQYVNLISSDSDGNLLFKTSAPVSIPDPSYILVDKKGIQKNLTDPVVAALKTAHNTDGDVILKSADEALLTNCEYQEKIKSSRCKIIDLNLNNGSTKTLLEFNDSGLVYAGDKSPLLDLQRFSKDKKSVYLEVAGPTDLGKSKLGFYEFNLQTNKATLLYEVPENVFAGTHATISPDGKKVVYLLSVNSSLVLHIVDISSKQDTSVTWKKDEGIGNYIDSEMWHWSPDGSKVLFSDFKPATIAYLDLNKNIATDLVKVDDTDHYDTRSKGWIDDKTIVYAYNHTNTPNNFVGSAAETYKLNITTKAKTKLNGPTGYFSKAVDY